MRNKDSKVNQFSFHKILVFYIIVCLQRNLQVERNKKNTREREEKQKQIPFI